MGKGPRPRKHSCIAGWGSLGSSSLSLLRCWGWDPLQATPSSSECSDGFGSHLSTQGQAEVCDGQYYLGAGHGRHLYQF